MPRSNDDPRRHVQILPERVGGVSGNEFPGHYPGEDHSWSLQKFKQVSDPLLPQMLQAHNSLSQNLIVSVQRLTPSTVEFDLVGVDASIANALRRVMIAEVPTIAIEDIYVWNNTSIMQDEVLCHRLGLVPLKIDPRKLVYKPSASSPALDNDTIVFQMRVRCDRIPGSKGETDPEKMYYDSNVYTGMLQWEPAGEQANRYKGQEPRPVDPDILLLKLRPGQVSPMLRDADNHSEYADDRSHPVRSKRSRI